VKHEVAPGKEKKGNVQFVHTEALAAAIMTEYVFAGHLVQMVEFSEAVYCPGGQAYGIPSQAQPGGQASQITLPGLLVVPAGQYEQ